MVGDHKQLPATVTSERAQELGYQRSLFSRLISIAGSHLLRLETQYRMVPAISLWPSSYFYDGKLRDGAPVIQTGLNPLLLINVAGEMEQTENHGVFNKTEEICTLAAVEAVQCINQRLSIGVITFYKKQKENITRGLTGRLKDCDKVDTVDGFQGNETLRE